MRKNKNMSRISPRYKMSLIQQTASAIWKQYSSYVNVLLFIEEFQEEIIDPSDGMSYGPNFQIFKQKSGAIDLITTLARMPEDVLFSIAIECGISIPMIIPAFPTFKRDLTRWEHGTHVLIENFNKAYRLAYEDPSQSIALANSTLESIIKHILESGKLPNIKYNKRDTLYELTNSILKEFKFVSPTGLQTNIRNIGSSLLKVAKNIEELRSDKTFAHGKGQEDYIIDNKLYSVFVVNCVITVGMFLISFFEEKYVTVNQNQLDEEDVPF